MNDKVIDLTKDIDKQDYYEPVTIKIYKHKMTSNCTYKAKSDDGVLTVGELREALKKLPADAPIYMQPNGYGNLYGIFGFENSNWDNINHVIMKSYASNNYENRLNGTHAEAKKFMAKAESLKKSLDSIQQMLNWDIDV